MHNICLWPFCLLDGSQSLAAERWAVDLVLGAQTSETAVLLCLFVLEEADSL